MKSLILIFFTLICTASCFAQGGKYYQPDIFIENNPYDNAPDNVKKKGSYNRERWFYEQRMYPNNYIPEDAYKKAYEERERLRREKGFFSRSMAWTNIGPTTGFLFSYGNISSRIPTIKVDPLNPGTIYIGAAFGGVWKSTNAGQTWNAKSDNEVSLSSGALEIDPVNTNIIYYGTGEATYSAASYYGRGLLKSTNGGDTWTSYTAGLPASSYFSRLVIRPGHTNELFGALGVNGLYKSTDAGVTWTVLVSGRCDDVVFTPSGDTAYCIGSGTGYRISTNGGTSFTSVTTSGLPSVSRAHISLCKTSPNVLYTSIYNGSTTVVYKSTNAGLNFTQLVPSYNFNGGQAWYDLYMHVSPYNPNVAYVGIVDIFRTTDGGATFQNITNVYNGGNVHPDQHNMEFDPSDPNKVYCTNDGGIWYSTNQGTNWLNINGNLTLTQFYRIASDPSNSAHIAGGTQDNGTQRTLGTLNWTAAFGGDGGEVCFNLANPQQMLGETQNNGVQRSLNGGASWSNATSGLTGSGSWVGPLISHPDSVGIFYTARQSVFKTTNTGQSWTAVSGNVNGSTAIREMAISRTNPSIMFATSAAKIFRSSNNGSNWTLVSTGTPNRTITGVYVHPDSSNVAYVTFSGFGAGKLYKTTNDGTSWFSVSGNLPDSPVNDVLIYYPGHSTSTLLVGMDVGVFISNDYGATWSELADGLPNTVAMHLDYNLSANKIRIGTHGRGVYETSVLTGVINYSSEVPEKFSLQQNYPNPFNPSTVIRYSITNSSQVSLTVYDALGREVKNLVNEKQNPGKYDVSFDASGLTSGIYFYTLKAGNFKETKKMLFVK